MLTARQAKRLLKGCGESWGNEAKEINLEIQVAWYMGLSWWWWKTITETSKLLSAEFSRGLRGWVLSAFWVRKRHKYFRESYSFGTKGMYYVIVIPLIDSSQVSN